MIVVTVMTRDEEKRIGLFCDAYKDADKILVADGGSVDKTKEIANQFPNVLVRDFTEKVELKNGYWRNPQWKHLNFLFDWAREYTPDWIIFDDADCRPNKYLKQDYRDILYNTQQECVMASRLYLWGLDKHFPYMCKPGRNHDTYETSLWAWKGDLDIRSVDVPPASEWSIRGKHVTDIRKVLDIRDIMPPYCLLHYSWDDKESVEKKLKFYRESGQIPNMLHPLDFAGPLELLPEFAYE